LSNRSRMTRSASPRESEYLNHCTRGPSP